MSFRKRFTAIPIAEGRKYRAIRVANVRREFATKLAAYSGGAIIIGFCIGFLSARTDDGETRLELLSTQAAEFIFSDDPSRAYYHNCAAARRAGAAPIYRGQPGYRSELDADGDGVACEPFRG